MRGAMKGVDSSQATEGDENPAQEPSLVSNGFRWVFDRAPQIVAAPAVP